MKKLLEVNEHVHVYLPQQEVEWEWNLGRMEERPAWGRVVPDSPAAVEKCGRGFLNHCKRSDHNLNPRSPAYMAGATSVFSNTFHPYINII